MKTTEEILTEMIMKNKNRIEENEKKYNGSLNSFATIIEELIKKTKKITLVLSIATILNSISIIILNFWR